MCELIGGVLEKSCFEGALHGFSTKMNDGRYFQGFLQDGGVWWAGELFSGFVKDGGVLSVTMDHV